jgi:hypothetical protein
MDVFKGRKQAVSIRMSAADVRNVKHLAQRIGARDSDVIRFAVKSLLSRLGPLYDPQVRGRGLVPVFVESGADLLRFFELDASRLEAIINAGAEAGNQVERDDLALLALAGAPGPYAALMLRGLNPPQASNGSTGSAEEPDSLRRYLYKKYVHPGPTETHTATEPVRVNGLGALHE